MSDHLETYIEPEFEARIVAMVLGEASAFETEELERLIEERAELKLFRDRMEAMHGMLQETGEGELETDEDWTLPVERREALFQIFDGEAIPDVKPVASANMTAKKVYLIGGAIAASLAVSSLTFYSLSTSENKSGSTELALNDYIPAIMPGESKMERLIEIPREDIEAPLKAVAAIIGTGSRFGDTNVAGDSVLIVAGDKDSTRLGQIGFRDSGRVFDPGVAGKMSVRAGGKIDFPASAMGGSVNGRHRSSKIDNTDPTFVDGVAHDFNSIESTRGTVALAAGSDIVVDQPGGSTISIQSGSSYTGTGVNQEGSVTGAATELQAHGNAFALAINSGGLTRATGGYRRNGRSVLKSMGSSNRIVHAGRIEARNPVGRGDSVSIDGDKVEINGTIDIAGVGANDVGTVDVIAAPLVFSDTADVISNSTTRGGSVNLSGGVSVPMGIIFDTVPRIVGGGYANGKRKVVSNSDRKNALFPSVDEYIMNEQRHNPLKFMGITGDVSVYAGGSVDVTLGRDKYNYAQIGQGGAQLSDFESAPFVAGNIEIGKEGGLLVQEDGKSIGDQRYVGIEHGGSEVENSESTKLNLQTSAGGLAWNTPRAGGDMDMDMAGSVSGLTPADISVMGGSNVILQEGTRIQKGTKNTGTVRATGYNFKGGKLSLSGAGLAEPVVNTSKIVRSGSRVTASELDKVETEFNLLQSQTESARSKLERSRELIKAFPDMEATRGQMAETRTQIEETEIEIAKKEGLLVDALNGNLEAAKNEFIQLEKKRLIDSIDQSVEIPAINESSDEVYMNFDVAQSSQASKFEDFNPKDYLGHPATTSTFDPVKKDNRSPEKKLEEKRAELASLEMEQWEIDQAVRRVYQDGNIQSPDDLKSILTMLQDTLTKSQNEVNHLDEKMSGLFDLNTDPLKGIEGESHDMLVGNPKSKGVIEREKSASTESFSTFSLHVSDVSFKLAHAALAKGEWPDPERIRLEEFVNAFDYEDPVPNQEERVSATVEQAIHPTMQQRNILRIAMRTAEAGRNSSTPLNLTFLIDSSGSMERFDRQETLKHAFSLLAKQLNATDKVSLISFARQPRLVADALAGNESAELVAMVAELPGEGGTNLEAALKLAFEKAKEHADPGSQNRIILLTDGAANLGDANPDRLSGLVEKIREAGIAFDAAGIGAEGLNDEILEALTRRGDGRYYLLDRPEDADEKFAKQIAGALRPAAMNVKVQIEFNPERVGRYQLYGFEKHRLKKEDFRNDSVDAAEMAAAEAGVALYHFEPLSEGLGDVGSVSVRFKDMATGRMVEKRWPIPYHGSLPGLNDASETIRLATLATLVASKFKGEPLGELSEWDDLAELLGNLSPTTQKRERVKQLNEMIVKARSIK